MKNIKNILLCIILITGSFSYAANQYLQHNSYSHSPITIDTITKTSYISPDMQWAMLSLQRPDFMEIATTTGIVQNIPTIGELLTTINQQLHSPATISNEHKESLKSALHAMLEATEIALATISIKMGYQEPGFAHRNDLLMALNTQKTDIQNVLNKVNAINQSYASWIFGAGGPSKAPKLLAINPQQVAFDPYAATIMVPAELMPSIIQSNDYKQQSDASIAANLLFQQCFIAQQQYGNNPIQLNPNNPFGAVDYMYGNFPKIYIKYSNTYPICDDILKLELHDRRARLLQIRQAVQTALSIANKKSGANIGFQYLTSFFDGVVAELMRYDAYLSTLCKNPNYGATSEDIAKAGEWSTMSKVAAGAIVVAGTAALIHAYDPKLLPDKYNQITGNQPVYGPITPEQAAQKIKDAEAKPNTSASWWGGSKAQPTSGSITSAQQAPQESNEIEAKPNTSTSWWSKPQAPQPVNESITPAQAIQNAKQTQAQQDAERRKQDQATSANRVAQSKAESNTRVAEDRRLRKLEQIQQNSHITPSQEAKFVNDTNNLIDATTTKTSYFW